MDFGQNLFDAMIFFFGLDFLKFSGPLWVLISYRKRAKKKADLQKEPSRSLDQDLLKEESIIADQIAEQKPQKYKDKVFGVFIHYSECLKLDFFVLHPIVRVSLVDLSTGKFIAKSDRNRKVTSYYEGSHVSHIAPLMSQPYDFKMKRSIGKDLWKYPPFWHFFEWKQPVSDRALPRSIIYYSSPYSAKMGGTFVIQWGSWLFDQFWIFIWNFLWNCGFYQNVFSQQWIVEN